MGFYENCTETMRDNEKFSFCFIHTTRLFMETSHPRFLCVYFSICIWLYFALIIICDKLKNFVIEYFANWWNYYTIQRCLKFRRTARECLNYTDFFQDTMYKICTNWERRIPWETSNNVYIMLLYLYFIYKYYIYIERYMYVYIYIHI